MQATPEHSRAARASKCTSAAPQLLQQDAAHVALHGVHAVVSPQHDTLAGGQAVVVLAVRLPEVRLLLGSKHIQINDRTHPCRSFS